MPKRHRHEEGSPEEPVKKQAKQNALSLSQALRFPERLINWAADATASIIVSTDNYFNRLSHQQRVVAEENLAQPEQGLAEIEAKQSLNLLDLPNELIEKITLNLGVNDMANLGLTSKKAYALIYSKNEYAALRFNKGISLKEHYTHLGNSLLIEAQYIRDNWQGKSSFHIIPEAFKHGPLLDAPFNLGKINEINRLLDECNARVIKSKIVLTQDFLPLSNRGLTRFPQSLLKDATLAEYWGALRVLDLSHNQLAALPAEIGNLQALENLNLRNNKFTELPAEIGNLQALENLKLSNNKLTELRAEIGNLRALEALYLENNKLAELPAEIGNLQKLTWLTLDNNLLTKLPADIGKLQKLTSLILDKNKLTSLPAEIGNLQALRELYLRNNKLTELPAEIGNLQELKGLFLSHNHLTAEALGSIPELFREDNWLAGALVTQTLLSEPSPVIPRSPVYLRGRVSCTSLYLLI